jgi:uncharacterized phiE125 gp8 family phage protein
MKVVVISPPTPVVTKEEAKQHLLVEHSGDDFLIETLIQAATAWLDGPAGWLSRAIGVQILEWQSCEWPCHIDDLPFPPMIGIVSVKYIDPEGVEQSWPLVDPISFINMPSVRGQVGDVKIRYRAGYGAPADDEPTTWVNAAPAPIKVSIMMLVAQWYRTREAAVVGASVEALPFGVEQLLQPYRVYR